jgi:hypothetical protein
MKSMGTLTKILASAGTALVWFPLLAPVVLSVIAYITTGVFRFDYLMPAELFPAALAGGGLLLWAAFRTQAQRARICGGLVAAIVLLVGGQALAVVTGLASGETKMGGWQGALVLASLAGFWLALMTLAVGGILLLRDLFKPVGK